jgi:hypothetical protein
MNPGCPAPSPEVYLSPATGVELGRPSGTRRLPEPGGFLNPAARLAWRLPKLGCPRTARRPVLAPMSLIELTRAVGLDRRGSQQVVTDRRLSGRPR